MTSLTNSFFFFFKKSRICFKQQCGKKYSLIFAKQDSECHVDKFDAVIKNLLTSAQMSVKFQIYFNLGWFIFLEFPCVALPNHEFIG